MKQGVQLLLLLSIFASLFGCKKKSDKIVYDKKYIKEIKAIRKDIAFYASRNSIPGISIAIAKDGKLIYSEGMGTASKDFEIPVTRKTKFRIGQLSEIFTSFIYHKMVDEGKLCPDSTVQYYLPNFPKKMYDINLRHLVNQTSGIREAHSNEENWRGLNISLQKGLDKFKNDPLQSPPGIYQTNSMYNYNLLGAIMEKATNKRFNIILKEYISDTLKLNNTLVDNPFMTIKDRTDYYDHNFISQVINATSCDMRYRAPSEGILSNAEDLVKFGNTILYSDYLSEDTKNKMFEAIPLADSIPSAFSNGWMLLKDKEGENIYGKSGAVIGGSASILIYPEYGLVIACASNLKIGINDTPIFDISGYFTKKPEGNN